MVPLPNDPNQTHQLTSASTSVAVDSDKHFNNDNNRVEEDEQQRDMSVEATPPINETVVEEKCPPSPTLESFGISEFSKVLLATGEDGYIDSGVVGRR